MNKITALRTRITELEIREAQLTQELEIHRAYYEVAEDFIINAESEKELVTKELIAAGHEIIALLSTFGRQNLSFFTVTKQECLFIEVLK